jgi:signal transduction histidine kinase
MTKILVIEDERPLLEEILDTLYFENFEVVGTENGVDGIALARQDLPDVIICDIMMPKLNGYDVLAELRADPATFVIPFIFLTAKAEKTDLRHGMELGADDYLTKPFTNAQLLASINTRLAKRKLWSDRTEQKLNTLREQVLLSLPHELRTPLTSILGYAELLIDNQYSLALEDIPQIGSSIYHAALRLHRLIENYLSYVQIEQISQHPVLMKRLRDSQTLEPSQLIHEQARKVALTHRRDNDLYLEVDDIPYVSMSRDYFCKLIEELVDNAFKFSRLGTPVCVRAASYETHFLLEIQDQGRGMTDEQITAIGAYMQFERNRYEQQGGGFGLIIAKRLVELHNGQFTIESTSRKGTMVRVSLP